MVKAIAKIAAMSVNAAAGFPRSGLARRSASREGGRRSARMGRSYAWPEKGETPVQSSNGRFSARIARSGGIQN